MPRFFPIILAFVIGFVTNSFDAPAQADLVTEYTVSTSPNPQQTDFTQTLTVPTFDTTKGTLESVVVSYMVTSDFQGKVTNNSNKIQSFVVQETSNYMLSLGSSMLLSNSQSSTQTYNGTTGNSPPLGANSSTTFGEFTQTASTAPTTYTSGSIFNAFQTSNPDVSLTFGTLTSTTTTGGGGQISAGVIATAGATLSVEYFYLSTITVPEPASLVMTSLGLFFGSSCWLVKKRRSRSKPVG